MNRKAIWVLVVAHDVLNKIGGSYSLDDDGKSNCFYLINVVEHYLQINVECRYIVWPYSKISEVITDNQKHGSLWETSWWKLL